MKSHYAILGIRPECTLDEIKAAYRKLVKMMHPDVGGNPAEFRDIRNAYEVLSDSFKRREYDEMIARLPFGGQPYKTVKPIVVSEPVDVFDDLVDVLSRRFGLDRKNRIEAEIILSQMESERGINLELAVPTEVICHRCFGFGGSIISVCRHCRGRGVITGRKDVYLTVVPGARDGDIISVRSGNIEVTARIKIEK